MPFSLETRRKAFSRARARCECHRKTHRHPHGRCPTNNLVFEREGLEGRGAWDAHHKWSNGPDTLGNCEVLCTWCHHRTKSYGAH